MLNQPLPPPLDQSPAATNRRMADNMGVAWHAVNEIRRRYPSLNKEALEDVFQSACLGMWQADRTYDPTKSSKWFSWVFTNARFYALRAANDIVNKRLPQRPVDVATVEVEDERNPIADWFEHEEYTEVRAKLAEHISPRALDILLRRAKGESLQEIGDTYGTSRENIRQIQERALTEARRRLGVSDKPKRAFRKGQ